MNHNPNRVSHYLRYEKDLNMTGITYPVRVKQISKFESQNDVSVNVFGFEDGDLFPIYISKYKDKKHEVDLLYLTKEDNDHYCYIKHLNRLLSRTKNSGRAYKFCRYCLRGFTSQKVLDGHQRYCSRHDAQHVVFPTKGTGEDIIEFDDFSKQMRVPFVIYCDLEAFARQLLERLFEEEECIKKVLDNIESLRMTPEEEHKFQDSTHCHICNEPSTPTSGKVRDHSHLSWV